MGTINEIDEIPKHRKKKESNTSKSKNKTNHKHEYAECLTRYPFTFGGKVRLSTYACSYCTICGKIGDRIKDGIISADDKPSYAYSSDELFEKYKDSLPVFELENLSQKYVPVDKH